MKETLKADFSRSCHYSQSTGGGPYLVVLAGVSQQVPEEVEAGALAHQDEVGGAVGQVGGGRQAFGAARAGAAHAGGVDGQELPADGPPLAAAALCRHGDLGFLPLPPAG